MMAPSPRIGASGTFARGDQVMFLKTTASFGFKTKPLGAVAVTKDSCASFTRQGGAVSFKLSDYRAVEYECRVAGFQCALYSSSHL